VTALPNVGPLWELKASSAQLAKKSAVAVTGEYSSRERDFAAVMLEHPFVEALQIYLISLNSARVNEGEEHKDESPVISAY
jgi:hypothetical protein